MLNLAISMIFYQVNSNDNKAFKKKKNSNNINIRPFMKAWALGKWNCFSHGPFDSFMFGFVRTHGS